LIDVFHKQFFHIKKDGRLNIIKGDDPHFSMGCDRHYYATTLKLIQLSLDYFFSFNLHTMAIETNIIANKIIPEEKKNFFFENEL